MKSNKLLIVGILAVLVLGFLAEPAFGQARKEQKVLQDLQDTGQARVIIVLKDFVPFDAPLDQVRDAVARAQEAVLNALSQADFELRFKYQVVHALAGSITSSGLDKLKDHPLVESIEPDEWHAAPNSQSRIRAQLTESVPLINATAAHSKGITGTGVVAALVDSGVDFTHPDLQDSRVAEKCFEGCTQGPDKAPDDCNHGTPAAGIITSNGTVAPKGVAPNAKIVAVKVFAWDGSQCGGFDSAVLFGIDWVIQTKSTYGTSIMIVNHQGRLYSVECDNNEGGYRDAINRAKANGIVTIAPTGNHGSATSISTPGCLRNVISAAVAYDANIGSISYPGICADSTTFADKVTCYSNTNAYADVVAPAQTATTTRAGGGTTNFGGTSAAAPMATALAALMKQANPSISPDGIMSILKSSGVAVTDTKNNLTFPRVDAFSALFIEIGEVNVNYNWLTVTLKRKFTNPVVVAKPMGSSDTRPALVRLGNITSTSFQIRIQEWDYLLPEDHGYERVGYIVMEKGFYNLKSKGGVSYQAAAGTVNTSCTNGCWATASYGGTFSSTPAVMSSVMTLNGIEDAVVTRNTSVLTSQFSVQMQEEEANNQIHATETLGFLAWLPTSSTSANSYYVDGKIFQVARTGAVVTDAFYRISFNSAISGTGRIPVSLADMQTKNGTDPAELRWRNKGTTGVDVRAAEEQSRDSETTHAAEIVGWLAFSCVICTTSFSSSSLSSTETGKEESTESVLAIHGVKALSSSLREMTFEVQGRGIASLRVDIYDLNGRAIFTQESMGSRLTWNLRTQDGKILANGVYLYVVAVRGFNGEVIRSQVKKLVILR